MSGTDLFLEVLRKLQEFLEVLRKLQVVVFLRLQETGLGEMCFIQRYETSHRHTLSHNVVSSTSHHDRNSNSQL